MSDYLIPIFLFIPAGIANMIPVLVAKWKWFEFLNKPVDGGRTWRGKRILGDHKTWRGLLIGSVFSGLLCLLLGIFLKWDTREYSDTNLLNVYIYGFGLGFFALLGDMVKSFIKRQLEIPSGKSWFPWDQSDYILGGFVMWWLAGLRDLDAYIDVYVVVFLVYFGLHLLVSYVGYLLRFKKDPI